MASRNLNTYKAAHEAFNRRDFDALVNTMTDNVAYDDRARGTRFNGRQGFKEFLHGWVQAFSDAEVSSPQYIDGGETVVALFTGRGTNDGPLGPFAKTGRQMKLPFCEVMRFNAQGQIVSGEIYYDQQTLLSQLGHVPASV